MYFVLASYHFNVTYVLLLLLLYYYYYYYYVVVVVVVVVVAGCQQYLDHFTLRHDSILNFIAKSLQPVINVHSSLYADVKGFLNPSIITGENYGPELPFLIQSKCLNVLE